MAQSTDVDLAFLGPVYLDLVMGGVSALPTLGSEVYATSLDVSPGGTATRAVAAARVGARTALLTRFGTDEWGDRLVAALSAEPGLVLDGAERGEAVGTPVSVAVVAGGDRTFVTHEVPRWRQLTQQPGPRRLPRALHLDVSAPVPLWVSGLRQRGCTVVGGIGYVDTPGWGAQVRAHLADVDVFVPNDDEAQRATGTVSPEAAAAALAEHVGLAVVTRGARGVVACDGVERVEVGGAGRTELGVLFDDPVVDTTGAGDVFVATFMAAGLEDWSLHQRLQAAVVCSALSVRRPGGASSAPTRVDLRAWWGQLPPDGRAALAHLEAWTA